MLLVWRYHVTFEQRLNFGEKIAEGNPEVIQNHPEVIKAYLGEATKF